jgi:hypothetical protein
VKAGAVILLGEVAEKTDRLEVTYRAVRAVRVRPPAPRPPAR